MSASAQQHTAAVCSVIRQPRWTICESCSPIAQHSASADSCSSSALDFDRSAILERARESGGRPAPSKNTTYGPRFVTYLARFLLNFDSGSRQLWEKRARSIPADIPVKQATKMRRQQFAEFAGAVEVGLLDYQVSQQYCSRMCTSTRSSLEAATSSMVSRRVRYNSEEQ